MPDKRNTIAKVGKHVVSFSDTDARPLDEASLDPFAFLSGRPATGPPLLTVREVARLLRCSVSSLNKWRLTGDGPAFVRVGSRVRYRPADVVTYVAEQTRSSTSQTNLKQEARAPP